MYYKNERLARTVKNDIMRTVKEFIVAYHTKSLSVAVMLAFQFELNHSQVSRHKKAQFFRGSGYFVCSQYKASASFGVSILSVPCGLFVL